MEPTQEELRATARRLGLGTDATTLSDLEILTRSNRAALAPPEQPHFFARGAYTFGYVTALIVPLIGFFVGLALIARPDDNEGRDGAWIVGLSLVGWAAYAIILAAILGK